MLEKTYTKTIINKALVLIPIILFFFLINTVSAAVVLTPGNINTCGELAVGGTYTLDNNIGTSTESCLTVTASSVIIEGQSLYSVTGNIVGNRDNYTISNTISTGDLSYFYYNNAQDDGDWSKRGNWWLDSSHTETASSSGNITIPTESDTVIIDGKVDKASSGTPTAHSARFINDSSFSAATLPLDIADDAAAAYSLRNLSSTYSGDVVEVRRSLDDTAQSFNAEEVDDGTLEAWVDEEIVLANLNIDGSNTFGIGGNGTTISSVASNNDGVGLPPKPAIKGVTTADRFRFSFTSGMVPYIGNYDLEFELYVPAGSILIGKDIKGTGGSYSIFTADPGYPSVFVEGLNLYKGNYEFRSVYRFLGSSNGASEPGTTVYMTELKITYKQGQSSGFVKTWFDQSGNGRDATQTDPTKQPDIIVDGGLIKDNDNTVIEFGGVPDFMSISGGLGSTFGFSETSFSAFAYLSPNSAYGSPGFISNSQINLIQIQISGANGADSSILNSATGPGSNSGRIFSAIGLSSGSARIYSDGSSLLNNTFSSSLNLISSAYIGSRGSWRSNHKMSELIFYSSDKTSSREQIEASINSYYDIYTDNYLFDLNLHLDSEGTATFEDNSHFGIGTISTSATSSVDTVSFQDNSYAEDLDVYTDNLNIDTDNTSQGTIDIKSDNTDITIDAIYSSTTLTFTGTNPDLILNGTTTLDTLTADDIDIELNDSTYIDELNLEGTNTSIQFNTDYYHGTSTPDNGELIINEGRNLNGTITEYNSNSFEFLDGDNDEITQITFNGTSTNEMENLNIYSEFNNDSINNSTIRANVEFFGDSSNAGTIYGNVTVNSPGAKPIGGTVNGNVTYQGYEGKYFNNAALDGDWNNANNWWTDASFATSTGVPIPADDVFIYGNLTTPTTQAFEVQSINFYSGTNDLTFITDNEVNFYGSSANNGVISATTTFHTNDSEHVGYVTNNMTPLLMDFDGVNDYVNFGSVGNCGVNCRVEMKFRTTDSGQIFFSQRDTTRSSVLYHTGLTSDLRFYNSNGNSLVWNGNTASIDIRDGEIHTMIFEKDGNNLSITIDGETQSVTKAFADSGNTADFAIGGHPNESTEFEGLIYDVKIDTGNTGIWQNTYNGYGTTDSAWLDQIGNSDGTVVGSPTATSTVTSDSGTLTRRYQSDTDIQTRDFTLNSGIWIIEAAGVDVDISSSTYATSSNVFRAINGGTFTENPDINAGEHVVPKVLISYPTNGTNTNLWNPSIDWDDADTCEYKYGSSGTYASLDCSLNGTDIPTPTAFVSTTLYVKGTYTNTSYSEQLQTFTYDNTAPTPVDCSIPLSESTREYYFLESDIYTDCYITNDITLKGGGYTIAGSVIANASSTNDAFDIILENIIIVGTTTANGLSGGNGGNITISTSTTASIESNGADGAGDGGNGGTIIITNSIANPLTSTITTNGGSSTSCGNGGNAGTITLTDSSYGTITNIAGLGENSGCPSQTKQSGTRTPPTTAGTHTSQTPSSSNTTSQASSSGREGFNNFFFNPVDPLNLKPTQEFQPFNGDNFIPNQVGGTFIPGAFDNFQAPKQIDFVQLPTNFQLAIREFVFDEEIPESISDVINSIPGISSLASIGTLKLTPQQLARLSASPILIKDIDDDSGLFTIKREDGSTIRTYLTYKDGRLAQLVKVGGGEDLKIQLNGDGEIIVGKYFGVNIAFTKKSDGILELDLQAPDSSGEYRLDTDSIKLPLIIEVVSFEPIEQKYRKALIPWLYRLIFGR